MSESWARCGLQKVEPLTLFFCGKLNRPAAAADPRIQIQLKAKIRGEKLASYAWEPNRGSSFSIPESRFRFRASPTGSVAC